MRTSRYLGSIAILFCAALSMWTTLPEDARGQDAPSSEEYVIRSGDTLFGIARRFGTTVEALKRANGLSGDAIQVGQRLTVPSSAEGSEPIVVPVAGDTLLTVPDSLDAPMLVPVSAEADSLADESGQDVTTDSIRVEPELGYLEVHPGQSLYEISFATGLPVDSLLAMNPEIAPFFADSSRLAVPAEYASVQYVVRGGDTLFKIARESGTSVEAIRLANDLSGDVIRIGQVLTVPSTRVASSPSASAFPPVVAEGEARVYPDRFAGRLTASGRAYDPEAFTISHADLPIGSIVLLARVDRDLRTFAEVTDRLPGSAGYLIDASRAVFRALGSPGGSNLDIEIRVVRFGTHSH